MAAIGYFVWQPTSTEKIMVSYVEDMLLAVPTALVNTMVRIFLTILKYLIAAAINLHEAIRRRSHAAAPSYS